jgi:hypothetical protein
MRTTLQKITLTLIAIVAVTLSAHGQQTIKHERMYTPNPFLPPDGVELAAYEQFDKGEFYDWPPEKRPADVPPMWVAVAVFQFAPDGELDFLGWEYRDIDKVDALHQNLVTL